jgi:ubiquinone/menaquinone biosynthesis C-methylase UbiE
LGISDVYGMDCFEESVKTARGKGVKAYQCDLEKERFPFDSDYFDIVISNQVFEHLKQIYMPLTEIYRVLKPNGHLLFGVPNLASLHNRFLLLIGKQPTCIQIFDEHVRAFTPDALIKFLTFNNLFEVVKFKGIGFYPLIPPASNVFSSIFPKGSVIILILLRKNYVENTITLEKEVLRVVKQTNY